MTGILLFLLSVMDLKDKKVNIWIVLSLGLVCIAGLFFGSDINLFNVIGGLMIGFGTIGFSLISNEQIGMGDGIIITFLGLQVGFRNGLIIVCMASFFAAVVSVILLIFKKGNRNTKLPFVPAIFLSYCICMVC